MVVALCGLILFGCTLAINKLCKEVDSINAGFLVLDCTNVTGVDSTAAA